MTILKLRCVYGRLYFVSKADWDQGRNQVPLRTRFGVRYTDLPDTTQRKRFYNRNGFGTTIHRENVANIVCVLHVEGGEA